MSNFNFIIILLIVVPVVYFFVVDVTKKSLYKVEKDKNTDSFVVRQSELVKVACMAIALLFGGLYLVPDESASMLLRLVILAFAIFGASAYIALVRWEIRVEDDIIYHTPILGRSKTFTFNDINEIENWSGDTTSLSVEGKGRVYLYKTCAGYEEFITRLQEVGIGYCGYAGDTWRRRKTGEEDASKQDNNSGKVNISFALKVYASLATVCVLGVVFTILEPFGVRLGWVWIFSGAAAVLLILYIGIFVARINRIVCINKCMHTNGEAGLYCGIAFLFTFCVIQSVTESITSESLMGRVIAITFTFILVFIFIYLVSFSNKKFVEAAFSVVYFDKKGVHSESTTGKNIFIPWDECVDIGWGIGSAKGPIYYMYFSKVQLTEKEARSMRPIEYSDKFLCVQFSKKLLADVLQYIDKERIARFDYIDEKGKSTGRW